MTSDNTSHIPFWHLTKEQQKREVEMGIREILDRDAPLTDCQKLFLRRALGHIARGQFGAAVDDIIDADRPSTDWSPSFKISPAEIEGVTKETLSRALRYSEAEPPQQFPIFFR